jgi:hypothetical protein
MSKGYKPNDKNRPDVVTVESEIDDGIIVDAGESCWQFPLEEKSSFSTEILVGTTVIGSSHENKILVRGNSRALGFAPQNVASEINQARLGKMTKLIGKVLSVDENDIWVELCLK